MEMYGVLSASTLEGCWIDDLAERIRVKEMLVVLLVDRKCGRTDLECGTLTRKGKNPSFYCAGSGGGSSCPFRPQFVKTL